MAGGIVENGTPLNPTKRPSTAGERVTLSEVGGAPASLVDLLDVDPTVTPAKGSILSGNGSVFTERPAGANGEVLVYDSGSPDGWTPTPLGIGAPNIVVFRPGGVTAGNVYDTWAGAVAAINVLSGERGIFLDSSLAPLTIPAGTYNLQDVRLIGRIWSPTFVTVPEGVQFIKLRHIVDGVIIEFTGSTPPVSDFANGENFIIERGAGVFCTGSGPFFQNTVPGLQWQISLVYGGTLATGTHYAVDAAGGGGELVQIVCLMIGFVEPNTIASDPGSIIVLLAGSAEISLSETHPDVLGTIVQANLPLARYVNYDDAITVFGTTTVQTTLSSLIELARTPVVDTYDAPLASGVTVLPTQSADFDQSGGFSAQPDIPRSLQVVFSGLWDGGDIEITGVNALGNTQTHTVVAAPGTTVQTDRADLDVTRIRNLGTWTAGDVTVELGSKIGLRRMGAGVLVFWTRIDKAPPTVPATVDTANGTISFTGQEPDGVRSYQIGLRV